MLIVVFPSNHAAHAERTKEVVLDRGDGLVQPLDTEIHAFGLIATYLRYKSVVWFQMLSTSTEKAGLSPLERVLAVFDALEEPLLEPSFRGCPFVKGMAEFGPEAKAPDVEATIAAYFTRLHDFVASLIEPLGLSKPEKAVIQILALIHGSIVIAQSTRDPAIVEANRDAARVLLEDGLNSSS